MQNLDNFGFINNDEIINEIQTKVMTKDFEMTFCEFNEGIV